MEFMEVRWVRSGRTAVDMPGRPMLRGVVRMDDFAMGNGISHVTDGALARWTVALACTDGEVHEALADLLVEVVRTFRMSCGRLVLSRHTAGAPPVTVCASAEGRLPACDEQDWIEHQAITCGGAVQVGSMKGLPYFAAPQGLPAPCWLVAAPLVKGEHTVGVLSLGRTEPAPLAAEELAALEALATTVAEAMGDDTGALQPTGVIGAELYTFFVQVPWPMLLVGEDGHVWRCNAAAERLLGQRAAALCGVPYATLVERDDEGVCHVRRKGGTRTLVEAISAQLLLGNGHHLTVVVLSDRANQQQAQEERLRMAELTGVFSTIATVNHQINNPLFGMMTTLQLLRAELGSQAPSVLRKVDRLEECCERIRQITETLGLVVRPARRVYAAQEGMLDLARATAADDAPRDVTNLGG